MSQVTYENFKKAVNEVYAYFDLKQGPSETQAYLWHKKAGFIPSEAIGFILEFIKDFDNKPRNLAKAFIAGWYKYREANPQKKAFEGESCPECKGAGFISAIKRKWDGGPIYEYVQPCSCKNSNKHFGSSIERTTKDRLKNEGFVVL